MMMMMKLFIYWLRNCEFTISKHTDTALQRKTNNIFKMKPFLVFFILIYAKTVWAWVTAGEGRETRPLFWWRRTTAVQVLRGRYECVVRRTSCAGTLALWTPAQRNNSSSLQHHDDYDDEDNDNWSILTDNCMVRQNIISLYNKTKQLNGETKRCHQCFYYNLRYGYMGR